MKQDLTEIRSRIGTSYADVGTCLLNDDTGQVIDAIILDKRESKYILDEIFRRWIAGEGIKYSWEGLIKCLKFAKLNVLAEDLELVCTGENKHSDQQTETISSSPSSIPTPHFKEKEQVNEQLKPENHMEYSAYVIFSVITALIITVLSFFFGGYWFKRDSTSGTDFPSHKNLILFVCALCYIFCCHNTDKTSNFLCGLLWM